MCSSAHVNSRENGAQFHKYGIEIAGMLKGPSGERRNQTTNDGDGVSRRLANQIHGNDPVQCRVSLYRLYEKRRHSISNSYAVVNTFAARRQKSFRKNNKERLR
jgi:hypothetical protein